VLREKKIESSHYQFRRSLFSAYSGVYKLIQDCPGKSRDTGRILMAHALKQKVASDRQTENQQ